MVFSINIGDVIAMLTLVHSVLDAFSGKYLTEVQSFRSYVHVLLREMKVLEAEINQRLSNLPGSSENTNDVSDRPKTDTARGPEREHLLHIKDICDRMIEEADRFLEKVLPKHTLQLQKHTSQLEEDTSQPQKFSFLFKIARKVSLQEAARRCHWAVQCKKDAEKFRSTMTEYYLMIRLSGFGSTRSGTESVKCRVYSQWRPQRNRSLRTDSFDKMDDFEIGLDRQNDRLDQRDLATSSKFQELHDAIQRNQGEILTTIINHKMSVLQDSVASKTPAQSHLEVCSAACCGQVVHMSNDTTTAGDDLAQALEDTRPPSDHLRYSVDTSLHDTGIDEDDDLADLSMVSGATDAKQEEDEQTKFNLPKCVFDSDETEPVPTDLSLGDVPSTPYPGIAELALTQLSGKNFRIFPIRRKRTWFSNEEAEEGHFGKQERDRLLANTNASVILSLIDLKSVFHQIDLPYASQGFPYLEEAESDEDTGTDVSDPGECPWDDSYFLSFSQEDEQPPYLNYDVNDLGPSRPTHPIGEQDPTTDDSGEDSPSFNNSREDFPTASESEEDPQDDIEGFEEGLNRDELAAEEIRKHERMKAAGKACMEGKLTDLKPE
ncbi:hypothetical protein K469DRAFT_808896 [Zopfia rhizophila CBS 207.26]|uniref:Fungal N-terminal domain-containing protein n=1 Tax=Zopfia rhizophila CBS 207.26 TaxID=1314779 RepID=A0A6A6EJD3_9PEZI|nr:hypothetical protein K469DRAFT_808896 [Zopfia rhizophila CBS 207.26]